MRGIHYDGIVNLRDDLPIGHRPGEALIRVLLAGICNTDIEILKGYAGFRGIPGHEFVGRVEACSAAEWVGRRVVGEINCGCGTCDDCRAGDPRHCPGRTTLGIAGRNGAFAEYLSLPVENLLEVPEEISDEVAVLTEPMAAACQILEQITVTEGMSVAVLGDGKLGLLIGQVLSRTGCDLVLYGRHPSKLRLAASWGLTTGQVSASSPGSPPGPPARYDVVVEATGSPAGFELALKLIRPRGTLVLKSTIHDPTACDLTHIVVQEIRIVGSRCGRFGRALRELSAHPNEARALLSEELPLERGVEALTRAQQSGVLKVLLRP